jgi:ABC-type multidrug transport system permease subunit
MRFVYVATLKDLRRRLADPAALAIWIGIPLVLAGMLNFISGTGGDAPRAILLIVDEDKTTLSGLIPAAARQGNAPIDAETVTLEEGRRLIDGGDASALLVIPAGFQNAVLGRGSATLQLVTNPAQRILPLMVQQPLEILVDGAFYAQRLFGEPIRRIADGQTQGPPADADIASIAVEINRQITALQGSLLPPVISVTVKTDNPSATPPLNFGQLFLPGMFFMSFLFVAQGMSADVWDEKREGTLRRLLTTPQTAGRLLLGKLLAGLVMTAIIALIGLLAAVAWFGLAWSRVPLALVWCVFASGALIALLTLLHIAGGSQRGGEMLSSVVVFPLMMLGGSFFPFEAMPAWMAAAGRWTPNGLAVARLKELLYGDPSFSALGVAALGIGIPAAVAFALARRRVRSFANA